jgi:cell division septal protein FtsQ
MQLLTWLAPVVLLLTVTAGLLFWFLRDHSTFHVRTVRVYGAERVPQPELIQLTHITRETSLLRIDPERVRARMMQHPWIREALVYRRYPNELEVIVYERRPAVILEHGPGYVLDGEGYLLGQATAAELASYPRLAMGTGQAPKSGVQVTDPAVQAGLKLLTQIHDSAFFRQSMITRIDTVTPERFFVQTPRGKFVVGANLSGIDEKLDALPVIDEVLRSRARRAEYIDFSVGNQIVVKTSARTTQGPGRLQKRGGGNGHAD